MKVSEPADLACQSLAAVVAAEARKVHPLTIEIASSCEALAALGREYERLQRVTGNTLPFLTHEWHVAWCQHLLYASGGVQPRPRIHVLRDAAGTCVGIVPMVEVSRHVGPLRIVTLELLGADPAITELRAPLIEPGYERSVARTLQRELGRTSWDWVHWTGVGGAFGDSLTQEADLESQGAVSAFVMDLPSSWKELRGRLKRNIRESLRHGYNSLRRDGVEFAFRVASKPQDVGPAIERFLVLHARRASLEGTTRHGDYFASAATRGFLGAVCARLAERGAVRVFELVIRGEVVATRIGFVLGNSLYLYYSGFDPAWARYGVMTTTLAEAIKDAIGHGMSSVNLSTGRDVSKTRWGPREVVYPQAFQVARSPLSRAAYNLYRRARNPGTATSWLDLISRRARRRWA